MGRDCGRGQVEEATAYSGQAVRTEKTSSPTSDPVAWAAETERDLCLLLSPLLLDSKTGGLGRDDGATD